MSFKKGGTRCCGSGMNDEPGNTGVSTKSIVPERPEIPILFRKIGGLHKNTNMPAQQNYNFVLRLFVKKLTVENLLIFYYT